MKSVISAHGIFFTVKQTSDDELKGCEFIFHSNDNDGMAVLDKYEEWSRKSLRYGKKFSGAWYRLSANKDPLVINDVLLTREVADAAINTWLAQEHTTTPLFAVK